MAEISGNTNFSKKKIAIVAAITISSLLMVQLIFIGVTIFKMNIERLFVSNLGMDIRDNLEINISVSSDIISPIGLSFSDMHVDIGYVDKDTSKYLATLGCKSIGVSMLSKLGFKTTIVLENVNIFETGNFLKANKAFIHVSTRAAINILFIPIRIPWTLQFKKMLDTKKTGAAKFAPFFENVEEARREFSKYFHISEDGKPIETDEPEEKPVEKTKTSVKRSAGQEIQVSGVKKISLRHLEFSTEVVNDEFNLNKIFKTFNASQSETHHIITIETHPIISFKFIRGMNILLNDVQIKLASPVNAEIEIKELDINQNNHKIKMHISKDESRAVIRTIAQTIWGQPMLSIQIDTIKHNSKILYDSNSLQDTRGLYVISRETNVIEASVFQFIFKNFIFSANKLVAELELAANSITALIGSMIHFIAGRSVFTLGINLNGSEICDFIIRPCNPLTELSDDGHYFKLLRFEVAFATGANIVVKKNNKINMKFKDFKGIAAGLNTVSIKFGAGERPILEIGSACIRPPDLVQKPPKIKKAGNYIINHTVEVPGENELLYITSSFSNFDALRTIRKFNLILEPFSCICMGSKFLITQSFDQTTYVHYQPDDEKIHEGDLLCRFSSKTKLINNVGPEQLKNPANFISDFAGNTLTVVLMNGETTSVDNNLILKIKLDDSILLPEIKQEAPTEEVADAFKIHPDCNIQWIEKGDVFGITLSSKISDLKSLICSLNPAIPQTFVNKIEIKEITCLQNLCGFPISINTSPILVELALIDKNLYFYLNKPAQVHLDIGSSGSDLISLVPSNTKPSILLPEDKGQVFNVIRLVNYFKTFKISDYSKPLTPKMPAISKEHSLSVDLKLKDSDKSGIKVDFTFGIPRELIPLEVGEKLDFLKQLEVAVVTGASNIKISINMNGKRKEIIFKVVGSLNLSADDIVMKLSIKNKEKLVMKSSTSKILSMFMAEKTGIEVAKIAQETQPLENIHIEPTCIKTTNDKKTEFIFKIFSEKVNRIIGKAFKNALINVPLAIHPAFVDMSIKIDELPMIAILSKGLKIVAINKVSCAIANKYPILYGKSIARKSDITHQDIPKMYPNGGSLEISHFTSLNKTLALNSLDFPIELSFTLDSSNAEKIVISKDFLTDVKFNIAESTIGYLHSKFISKPITTPLPVPLKPASSQNSEKTLKIWLSLEKRGAIVMRTNTCINFIRSPLSIFIMNSKLACAQIRLFGLLRDASLEKSGNYDSTLRFYLFENTAKENSKGKDAVPIKIFTLFEGSKQEIFSTFIAKELVKEYSKLNKAYMSKVINIMANGLIAVKSLVSKAGVTKIIGDDKNIEFVLASDDSKNTEDRLKRLFDAVGHDRIQFLQT